MLHNGVKGLYHCLFSPTPHCLLIRTLLTGKHSNKADKKNWTNGHLNRHRRICGQKTVSLRTTPIGMHESAYIILLVKHELSMVVQLGREPYCGEHFKNSASVKFTTKSIDKTGLS